MKNFLLVVPRFVNKGEYYNFPVGIAYVSSYLKKQRINVFCLNLCHYDKRISTEEILNEHIKKNNIDVLATGTMSWYWNEVEEILKLSKKIKPDIINILGGAIIISDTELAMRNLAVDIGLTGEGELTMSELANVLSANGDINKVNGICYMKDGKLITTPPRPFIDDLDSLPFPDYEGFEFREWNEVAKKSGTMDILTEPGESSCVEIIGSRSCPFSCTFCYHHLGKKYRQRSLDNIFSEIEYLINNYQINSIYFLDELFSANHERMKQFAERIKKYNIKGWGGSFRVNDVNLEILKTLKNSGLKQIGYGLENINDEILKSMNKRITKAEIEKALKLTKEAGIFGNGNIIFGDPVESEITIRNTLEWVKDNPQFNISMVFVKVIPDSPLFQYAIKHGLIKNKLKHIKERFPIINLTKISDRKFHSLVKKIAWIEYTGKFKSFGRVVESIKIISPHERKKKYSIKIQCPFCGYISHHEVCYNNALYIPFLCKQCRCNYKIKNSEIFLKDYDLINAYLNHFKIFVLCQLQTYEFFRNNRSLIIKILSKIKRNLNPINYINKVSR